jgi:ribosomal protein S18 acetylase RimI-like enzyme
VSAHVCAPDNTLALKKKNVKEKFMKLKLSDKDLILCDYANPQHKTALWEMINAYIKCDMGGGKELSLKQKDLLAKGLSANTNAITLFALYNGTIAAVLIAFINFSTFECSPCANIHDIFVKKEFRRKGLAKKLLKAIEEIAKNNGCKKITLEVRKDNTNAQKLYASFGFSEGKTPMYFYVK